jgi:hypothetical protein
VASGPSFLYIYYYSDSLRKKKNLLVLIGTIKSSYYLRRGGPDRDIRTYEHRCCRGSPFPSHVGGV